MIHDSDGRSIESFLHLPGGIRWREPRGREVLRSISNRQRGDHDLTICGDIACAWDGAQLHFDLRCEVTQDVEIISVDVDRDCRWSARENVRESVFDRLTDHRRDAWNIGDDSVDRAAHGILVGAILHGDFNFRTRDWLLVQKNRFDEAQAQITSTLKELNTTMPEMRRSLWYLRAKAFDRSKNYDQAMDAASKANMIGEVEFSPDLYTKQLSSLISNWTRQRMSRFPTSQCSSAIPVFVAGMPRSGTSLIDQIIDAHPLAAGVGELNSIDKFSKQLERDARPGVEPPACFGAMQDAEWTRMAEEYVAQITAQAPGAQRIVNKALGNNRLLGLIARLFPKTRIIHALRDPRDVAISCCMGGFNNKLFPWSTRMEWIARAWQGSREMMDHWKSSLDVPILEVSYERLVQQPDTEFPRIIEFLGLEWDEACTRFHESKRTVRTLSYDQVNRPLYTSSVSRHLNYAKSLQAIEWPRYDPNEIV